MKEFLSKSNVSHLIKMIKREFTKYTTKKEFSELKKKVDDISEAGPGENGATFTPFVSEDGTLSWSNDKNLTNPPSVNIKGGPGENGKDGSNGADGKDGYTPIRGEDYWTEDDKAEIKAYVDEAILGGAW